MARSTEGGQGANNLASEGMPKFAGGDNFDLSYDFLNAHLDPHVDGFAGLDGSRIANGIAHQDACVDGCSPLVHYNPPQQPLNQRGASSASAVFQPRLRHSISNLDYSCLQPQPMQFDMSGSNPPHMDFKDTVDSSATGQFQDNDEWGFVFDQPLSLFTDPRLSGGDDDNRSLAPSSTSCDSACDLDNRCTGVACANTKDACTDRNCPDLSASIPCEVANAAAALASIGGVPETQPPSCYPNSTTVFPMGLSTPNPFDHGVAASSSPASSMPAALPDRLRGITDHLLWAHGDPNSANCTRPCPIDDPHVFGHCHFPYFFHDYAQMPDSMPMYSFDFLNQSFKPTTGPEECGAQITSPDDFIQHFNAEHRQDLANAMSTRLGGNQTLLSAGASTTTSSANPFDISLLSSQESLKNPSPLTPLSTPHEPLENDYAKHQYSPSHLSLPDADHTTTAIETEWEHKCLWCHDLGSEPCGKVFADAGELFTHVNTAHIKHLVKGPKGFRCGWETCRREDDGKDGFPQRSKIERHMQTHIEHKPHVCEHCGKRFSAKQALNQHLLIHSNEKPLVCDWPGCSKTFRQQSALTMHRRVHTGEKPLKCDICGRTFSESSNLSKHKRTHEVKGRFTCPHPGCNRDFHRQDQLRRHTKLHAAEKNSRGEVLFKAEEMMTEDESAGASEGSAGLGSGGGGGGKKTWKMLSRPLSEANQDGQPRRKKRSC